MNETCRKCGAEFAPVNGLFGQCNNCLKAKQSEQIKASYDSPQLAPHLYFTELEIQSEPFTKPFTAFREELEAELTTALLGPGLSETYIGEYSFTFPIGDWDISEQEMYCSMYWESVWDEPVKPLPKLIDIDLGPIKTSILVENYEDFVRLFGKP